MAKCRGRDWLGASCDANDIVFPFYHFLVHWLSQTATLYRRHIASVRMLISEMFLCNGADSERVACIQFHGEAMNEFLQSYRIEPLMDTTSSKWICHWLLPYTLFGKWALKLHHHYHHHHHSLHKKISPSSSSSSSSSEADTTSLQRWVK